MNVSFENVVEVRKRIMLLLVYLFYYMAGSASGKTKQMLCSDWLSERARWAYLTRSGLPALFPQSWCNLLAI